jgi:8-hydroxy-5-deazaflavin:NADPH oxidoreductase
MRIGVVGAGMIGRALAVRFGIVGHEVMLSNSRGPATLAETVASIQGDVNAGTVAEAARSGPMGAVAEARRRRETLTAPTLRALLAALSTPALPSQVASAPADHY